MRTTITLRHLYNGSATGRETRHRVRGADGIHRICVRESGDGWGVHVWMTQTAARRLGVQVVNGDTILRCSSAPAGGLVVCVYGHDYSDPTATSI